MHISNKKQPAPQENIPSETQSSSRSTKCNFNTTTLTHVGSLPSSFSKTKHANRMFWIVPQGKRGDMKMPVSSYHWGELHVQNRKQYEYSGPRIQCFGYYRRENAVLFFSFFFFHLTYSRWTSSLPSCLWSQRIFPSLPGSRLTFFLSRCKFSTLTTPQLMVEFYLLTFLRFPLRKK